MGLTAKPEAARVTSATVEYDPQSQEGWVTTRLDFLVNWCRANSLWPMPFGTACCAIEFMASAATKFDLARFGMERHELLSAPGGRFDLRRAGPSSSSHRLFAAIWQQMPQPKWCISHGCVRLDRRDVRQLCRGAGIDTIIPVDVYVPGCPPRPEGLIYGIMMLQEKIKNERSSMLVAG